MKTLGILGGMSYQSTAIYYNKINECVHQKLGNNHSPRLILLSVDFDSIVELQKQGDWYKAGQVLADDALRLQQAGADAILLATNT